jgi:subtilisin family serine protease
MTTKTIGRYGRTAIAALGSAALTIGASQALAQSSNAPASVGLPACVNPLTSPDTVRTPCLAIIGFSAQASMGQRTNLAQTMGAVVRHSYRNINAAAVLIPNSRTLFNIVQSPEIARFEGDFPIRANPKPDNPGGGGGGNGGGGNGGGGGGGSDVVPSGVARVLQGVDPAVAPVPTGAGVGVAILDTGLDHGHADFVGNIGECYDAFRATGCEDDNDHGTHVGGIVAAAANQDGIVGVAPNAKLHGVKVLDAQGSGTNSSLMAGLDWVATNADPLNIRVANMSLSGVAPCVGTLLQTAVSAVRAAGVALYAAAGNADALGNIQSASLHFPANCDGVMAVASTTAQDGSVPKKSCASPIVADSASRWSNYEADISAPGQRQENYIRGCAFVTTEGIESLKRGGGTFEAFGTSMATPHVAGLAALLFESCNTASPDDVDSAINAGVEFGPHQWSLSYDDTVDEGIANAAGALAELSTNCGS